MNCEVNMKRKKDLKWVELRIHAGGADILIFVSDNGWEYKKEYVNDKTQKSYYHKDVSGYNIRFSMNNVAYLNFDDFNFINEEIKKAKILLENF